MLTLFGTLSAQADGFFYRFTTPLPTVTCTFFDATNPASLSTSGITIEWNLPEGASIDAYITMDGVTTFHGNYPLPSGTGSQLYAGVSHSGPAFPLDLAVRYDTIVGGQVVFQSTIFFSCAGARAGTSSITNTALGGGACLPIPEGSVVGDMPLGAQAYYSPGQVTNITINPGTYWVLGQDESGQYYEILLACQYLWVRVDTMQPSYQSPWSGQPLPTQVVS